MATDLISVDVKGGGSVEFDANMPMGALRKLFKAGNEGDLETMMLSFAKIVKAWSYEGDPTELDAWDEIGRIDFMHINEAIMAALSDSGEG